MITTLNKVVRLNAGDISTSLPLAHGKVMEGGGIIFVKLLAQLSLKRTKCGWDRIQQRVTHSLNALCK